MKKLPIAVLAIVLLVGLMVFAVACGDDEDTDTTDTTAAADTTTSSIGDTTTSSESETTSTTVAGAQAPVVVELTGDEFDPPIETEASGTLTLNLSNEAGGMGIMYELRVENLEREDIQSAGIYLPAGASLGGEGPGGTATTDGMTTTSGATGTTAAGGTTDTTMAGGATGTTAAGGTTGTTGMGDGQLGEMIIDLLAGMDTTTTSAGVGGDTSTTMAGGAGDTSTTMAGVETSSTMAGDDEDEGESMVIASGMLSQEHLVGSAQGMDIQQLVATLLTTGDQLYVQVNTQQNPSGELRGLLNLMPLAAGWLPATGEIGGESTTTTMGGATTSS